MSTTMTGRIIGALYLASAVAAGLPVMYVSGTLIVDGDAAATGKNILASEPLFRTCIVGELCGAVLLLFVARALYRLFRSLDEWMASLMVTFVAVSVPITFVNVMNELAALALYKGEHFLLPIGATDRDGAAMLFLEMHGNGVSLANVFWGLWLLPFGLLVLRSTALPKILGALLLVNGVALASVSLTALLFSNDVDVVDRFAIYPELGELCVMMWLLFMGAKAEPA